MIINGPFYMKSDFVFQRFHVSNYFNNSFANLLRGAVERERVCILGRKRGVRPVWVGGWWCVSRVLVVGTPIKSTTQNRGRKTHAYARRGGRFAYNTHSTKKYIVARKVTKFYVFSASTGVSDDWLFFRKCCDSRRESTVV